MLCENLVSWSPHQIYIFTTVPVMWMIAFMNYKDGSAFSGELLQWQRECRWISQGIFLWSDHNNVSNKLKLNRYDSVVSVCFAWFFLYKGAIHTFYLNSNIINEGSSLSFAPTTSKAELSISIRLNGNGVKINA